MAKGKTGLLIGLGVAAAAAVTGVVFALVSRSQRKKATTTAGSGSGAPPPAVETQADVNAALAAVPADLADAMAYYYDIRRAHGDPEASIVTAAVLQAVGAMVPSTAAIAWLSVQARAAVGAEASGAEAVAAVMAAPRDDAMATWTPEHYTEHGHAQPTLANIAGVVSSLRVLMAEYFDYRTRGDDANATEARNGVTVGLGWMHDHVGPNAYAYWQSFWAGVQTIAVSPQDGDTGESVVEFLTDRASPSDWDALMADYEAAAARSVA